MPSPSKRWAEAHLTRTKTPRASTIEGRGASSFVDQSRGVGPSGLVVDPQRIRGEDRRSREDLAGGTVRWGLQSLGSRAWPDRSAPASAMGISGLHPARSAFARIGGFGRALIACIGGFLNLGTITRLGCDFDGPFRDRAGNQTLRADRDRHGKPPRAARDNATSCFPLKHPKS